jgi:hypothetical protein
VEIKDLKIIQIPEKSQYREGFDLTILPGEQKLFRLTYSR